MNIEKTVADLTHVANYLMLQLSECESQSDREKMEGFKRAVLDAIKMLKAHEPKPPIIKENSYSWKFYYCPSCGKEFYQNNKFNFCEKFGQAVKWE